MGKKISLDCLAYSPYGPLAWKKDNGGLIYKAVQAPDALFPEPFDLIISLDSWSWLLYYYATKSLCWYTKEGPYKTEGNVTKYGNVETCDEAGYLSSDGDNTYRINDVVSNYHYVSGSGWDGYPEWNSWGSNFSMSASCAVAVKIGNPEEPCVKIQDNGTQGTVMDGGTLYDGTLRNLPAVVSAGPTVFRVLMKRLWKNGSLVSAYGSE